MLGETFSFTVTIVISWIVALLFATAAALWLFAEYLKEPETLPCIAVQGPPMFVEEEDEDA